MNLLPWLLDWPPSRSAVAVFVVLTSFSVGTLVLFSGFTEDVTTENVTVDAAGIDVRLNDERTIPDVGNGTVHTCLGSGTPGDHIGVYGDVTVDVPAAVQEEYGSLTLVVSLAHTNETTRKSITGSGDRTTQLFWLIEDRERLDVGDPATVELRVAADGTTLMDSTRSVVVTNDSRDYDC